MRKLYPSDIIANCKPITDFKFYCVYFLIQNLRIVYVGYSTNFGSRISAHMNSEKVFDSYYLIRCETESEALELEKHYIQTINPYFNGLHCDKSKSDSEGIVIKEKVKKERTYLNIVRPKEPILKGEELAEKWLKETKPNVFRPYIRQALHKKQIESNESEQTLVDEIKDNTQLVNIDFKIPRNSYMRKNDGYYYFSLSNEVYRAKSDLEKYFIKGCLYMPVGIFGSMDSIIG